ncbi:hypothetical protein T492DRAFT_1077579 [Pavlovales sp. CCMP2436]|nr:hypothetical protein T492DRAFT_1077579 [Pavlovales sp. CCMP2436]
MDLKSFLATVLLVEATAQRARPQGCRRLCARPARIARIERLVDAACVRDVVRTPLGLCGTRRLISKLHIGARNCDQAKSARHGERKSTSLKKITGVGLREPTCRLTNSGYVGARSR